MGGRWEKEGLAVSVTQSAHREEEEEAFAFDIKSQAIVIDGVGPANGGGHRRTASTVVSAGQDLEPPPAPLAGAMSLGPSLREKSFTSMNGGGNGASLGTATASTKGQSSGTIFMRPANGLNGTIGA